MPRSGYGRERPSAEAGGQARAEYGKRFDASNLRYMRLVYLAFPKCGALRHELSWTYWRIVFVTVVDDLPVLKESIVTQVKP